MIFIYMSHTFIYMSPQLVELMALLEEVYHWEAGFEDSKDMYDSPRAFVAL